MEMEDDKCHCTDHIPPPSDFSESLVGDSEGKEGQATNPPVSVSQKVLDIQDVLTALTEEYSLEVAVNVSMVLAGVRLAYLFETSNSTYGHKGVKTMCSVLSRHGAHLYIKADDCVCQRFLLYGDSLLCKHGQLLHLDDDEMLGQYLQFICPGIPPRSTDSGMERVIVKYVLRRGGGSGSGSDSPCSHDSMGDTVLITELCSNQQYKQNRRAFQSKAGTFDKFCKQLFRDSSVCVECQVEIERINHLTFPGLISRRCYKCLFDWRFEVSNFLYNYGFDGIAAIFDRFQSVGEVRGTILLNHQSFLCLSLFIKNLAHLEGGKMTRMIYSMCQELDEELIRKCKALFKPPPATNNGNGSPSHSHSTGNKRRRKGEQGRCSHGYRHSSRKKVCL